MIVYSIIVTYNGIKWIEKCLGSLKNSTINITVIVIDNGSTDGTVEFIESQYPDINLIKSPENLGFGQANNRGIKIAYENNADYFFLINQDAWVQCDTVEKLILSHKKNPEYGIISPIHLEGRGVALDLNFATYISKYKPVQLLSDLILQRDSKKLYETLFVNAAAWLLTKTCVNSVGGFSPMFFHYGEDDNYVNRARFHGHKIGFDTSAFIYHDRPQYNTTKYFDEFNVAKRNKANHFCNPNKKISIEKKIILEMIIVRAAFKKFSLNKALLEIIKSFLQNKNFIKHRNKTAKKGLHYLN